jgi:hypothetical protein
MVSGELSPPFFEGKEERNIGGHRKKGKYWGTAGARKKYSYPQYDSFMGIGGDIRELLEML